MLVLPDTEFSTPVATLALRKVVFEGAGGTDAPLAATWMCREVGTGVPPFPWVTPHPVGYGYPVLGYPTPTCAQAIWWGRGETVEIEEIEKWVAAASQPQDEKLCFLYDSNRSALVLLHLYERLEIVQSHCLY